jgi:hypothetical protein
MKSDSMSSEANHPPSHSRPNTFSRRYSYYFNTIPSPLGDFLPLVGSGLLPSKSWLPEWWLMSRWGVSDSRPCQEEASKSTSCYLVTSSLLLHLFIISTLITSNWHTPLINLAAYLSVRRCGCLADEEPHSQQPATTSRPPVGECLATSARYE